MTPTDEFIALCQSQVNLLTQGLAAKWVAIYLAEDLTEDLPASLVPVIIYPKSQKVWHAESSLTVMPQMWNQWIAKPPLLSTLDQPLAEEELENGSQISLDMLPLRSQNILSSSTEISLFVRNPYQVVLPLVHQEMVMGLLVAGRHDCPWQDPEISQLENIVETLAIACLLDRRQMWYEQQLIRQRGLRNLERDRIDDLLHQLRNPLTALKTFSKLLIKQFWGDDKARSVARSILRESDRLQDLLVQYEENNDEPEPTANPLTIETTILPLPPFKVLNPSPPLSLEKVNLQALLEPIIISAEAIAQEKQIRLIFQQTTPFLEITSNRTALGEILTNLINNAIKYTPNQGEVRVILGLRSEESGHSLIQIAIQDTGYGIPPEDRDRIFERHYRGIQAAGKIAGSGLGLAIVKELVDQIKGKIEVISPNPYLSDSAYPGSCFTLWLPGEEAASLGQPV
jgi:signal transduction histidine kinase